MLCLFLFLFFYASLLDLVAWDYFLLRFNDWIGEIYSLLRWWFIYSILTVFLKKIYRMDIFSLCKCWLIHFFSVLIKLEYVLDFSGINGMSMSQWIWLPFSERKATFSLVHQNSLCWMKSWLLTFMHVSLTGGGTLPWHSLPLAVLLLGYCALEIFAQANHYVSSHCWFVLCRPLPLKNNCAPVLNLSLDI